MAEKRYQIFISSTFTDLEDERRAIMEVILAMGHIPAGMELFSAGNQEQWELIKERIEECDYYIVVVAQRYGSVTDDGVSYTQKEYEYAREIGIPVAGFVLHSEAAKQWPRSKCDPEREAELSEFKALVQSLPVDFWLDAGDLRAKCAIALPKLIRKNPRQGWVSGDQVADPMLASELARLSAENETLRSKVKDLESSLPPTDLGQVADALAEVRFQLVVKFKGGEPEKECEEVSLRELFLAAAPSLLIENSVKGLRRRFLDTSLAVRQYLQAENETYYFDLNVKLGGEILGHFANRGLIEPSTKKRSLKDHHQYWTMTGLGRQLYRALSLSAKDEQESTDA